MKLNLAIFHHISSAYILKVLKILKFGLLFYPHAKFGKAAPVTIEMFDQVQCSQ